MTQAEWEAIDEHFKKGADLRRDSSRAVPWALHERAGRARRSLFATTGRLHRLVWLLTRRRFAAARRRAFRLPGGLS